MVFLAPALAAFAVWVFYPLGRTVWLGTQRSDPFGLRTEYVGFDQYREVLESSQFRNSLEVTLAYVAITVPVALVLGLGLALLANTQLRGMRVFRTIFTSTVASSVAVSALLWIVLLQPSVGIVNQFLESIGREPVDFLNDPDRALFAVSATSIWQNLGIVFVTVIAGLQAVPEELHEAARVDGHGAWSRFRNVTIPMISPTLLFTTVVLTIRAFQTFGEIDLLTQGGPNERTNVLTYSLYTTVYKERDPGTGAALAIVLFVIILILTLLQFRFLEKKVHYAG
jgi:sn-glycerol 3-phosphate transport system permease protein